MASSAAQQAKPHSAEALARALQEPSPAFSADHMLAAIRELSDQPASAEALTALARWAMGQNAFALAVELFEKAAAFTPNDANLISMLGAALHRCGRADEALSRMREAVRLAPDNIVAHANLGALLYKRGATDESIEHLSIVVAHDPQDPGAKLNLAEAFVKKQRYEDAFLMANSALDSNEARERALSIIAHIFFAYGDLERTLYYMKQAVDCPDARASISPYLFYLQCSDAHDDAQVFEEHARLGARLETPGALEKRHPNAPDPERRLRIGFVSADFYNHPTARFITPLLRLLDRNAFEIFAFPSNVRFDDVSESVRAVCDHWAPIGAMADADAAALIESHQIDILIDLSGHTNGNRLGVFGRKPAPVQATYVGYPGTTGMKTMDYRITSERFDPIGVSERHHVEKLIRLPGNVAPFEPIGELETNDLPSLNGAPFTFACLNQTWRINPRTVACWARILEAAPGSRMLIGNVDTPMIAQRLINLFKAEHISEERLAFSKRLAQREFLELYHHVDLCLDTFPYNGGTTTTYALWMGAPVVTLEGGRTAARTGRSILMEADLDQFVAKTFDEYAAIALDWAGRPHDLQELRRALRKRVKGWQQDEQVKHAREFGDALRAMWRDWSAARP